MSENPSDAQRAFEKKALESVRNLVDTIEAEDRDRSRKAVKRTLVITAVVAIVIAIAVPVVSLVRSWSRKEEATKPTLDMGTAEYTGHVLARILLRSNARNRKDMDGFDGRVEVNMAIGPKGYTTSFEVTKSSGDSKLDGTVTRLIKLSEPFGVLPAEVKTDVLNVKATYRIEQPSKLTVERGP